MSGGFCCLPFAHPAEYNHRMDQRAAIYGDLHGRQLTSQEAQNRESALIILQLLFEYVKPQSMLDVGCGLGTWLAAAKSLGIDDVRGVEGPWLDRSRLQVDPELVTTCDLEQRISLGRKFDLAVCLEVGEHLPEAAAVSLVASIADHADLVLFSAAIPHQGGHGHVNEQFPDYWAKHFASHGLRPLDCLRGRIWNDPKVMWWLRQNTLLFAHDRLLAENEKLRGELSDKHPLNIVHPDIYLSRLQMALQQSKTNSGLEQFLAQGGTFTAVKQPDGRITLNRHG